MSTTFVNRANTNAKVFADASAAAKKPIKTFGEVYTENKCKLLQHILQVDEREPVRSTVFKPQTLSQWDHGYRRQGRPKQRQWVDNTCSDYWDKIRETLRPPLKHQNFDAASSPHRQAITLAARQRLFTKNAGWCEARKLTNVHSPPLW